MDHGLNTAVIAVVAACVVAWTVISARGERLNISIPMAFIAMGAVLTNGPLAVIHIDPASTTVRSLAEVTLAIILFADASRIRLRALRNDAALPGRLLLIGFPITIGLGIFAAWVLFPALDIWVVAIIAASVAPTDAALGAVVVEDERVPSRIRRALNVESGLNDGIATPLVSFFIVAAVAEVSATAESPLAALGELAIGVAAGVVVGGVGGRLIEMARHRGWSSPAMVPIGLLALALLAYAGTAEAGGNGFVAAFVGGLAFGRVTRHHEETDVNFVAGAGELLSIVVWFVFGAVMVNVLRHANWRDVVFALVSLTVVRMIAVAIALVRSGLDRQTVLFMGWFGPRGLASVVFALLAFDALAPEQAQTTLATITTTVLISVVAHGWTAGPLSARYGAHARLSASGQHDDLVPHLPARTFVRRREP